VPRLTSINFMGVEEVYHGQGWWCGRSCNDASSHGRQQNAFQATDGRTNQQTTRWTSSLHRAPAFSAGVLQEIALNDVRDQCLKQGWPLSRQCEIPWRFATLLHSSRHVKCYSYHTRTSTKYLYGQKYAAYNKQFFATFHWQDFLPWHFPDF